MKNAHSSGTTLTVTAPAAVTSGTPFVLGTLLLVPVASAASGADVAAHCEGVFTFPKLSSAAITAGAKLHWDVSAGEFIVASTAAGDLENCAVAVAAAAASTTSVVAKLLPGVGTVKAS